MTALGIHLNGTITLRDWFNLHALPGDIAHRDPTGVGLLQGLTQATGLVLCNDPAQIATVVAATVAAGLTSIIFNDEIDLTCDALAASEVAARQACHAAGLHFIFAPTARMLNQCLTTVQHADTILYQAQDQQFSATFATDVHASVAQFRALHPGMPVWVQVSVNPPANRTATAHDVLGQIASLDDGSANAPDLICVWYDQAQTAVMQAVISALRP